MGAVLKLKPIGLEEFLEFEEASPIKHEYVDGYIYAMAGGSDPHNSLCAALIALLWPVGKARGCKVFGSDMKLVIAGRKSYYPDVMAICEADPGQNFKQHPSLLIEVLSARTERTDKGEKLDVYKTLPSLQAYLILDSRQVWAELHYRTAEGWEAKQFEEAGQIWLEVLETTLDLALLYEGVLQG
jgi:Uma2 family endonuclease